MAIIYLNSRGTHFDPDGAPVGVGGWRSALPKRVFIVIDSVQAAAPRLRTGVMGPNRQLTWAQGVQFLGHDAHFRGVWEASDGFYLASYTVPDVNSRSGTTRRTTYLYVEGNRVSPSAFVFDDEEACGQAWRALAYNKLDVEGIKGNVLGHDPKWAKGRTIPSRPRIPETPNRYDRVLDLSDDSFEPPPPPPPPRKPPSLDEALLAFEDEQTAEEAALARSRRPLLTDKDLSEILKVL